MAVSPLVRLTAADLIVRTGYQMGKTPLLPIYAAALGATDWFLGFIVSVSTITGMVLKPTVGLLSDRWGRRWWLLVGTAFFVGMPFLYRFVHTPDHLLAIRLLHGLATAIYGPVTFALVADWGRSDLGTRLGFFGMGRHGGYILGPAVGGVLLAYTDPVGVFTAIGLLSCFALVPVLSLPPTEAGAANRLPLRAAAGRVGDRFGFRQTITAGTLVMAISLLLLPRAADPLPFVAIALLLGASQALVFPSTMALVSTQVSPDHLGSGMGTVGALKNAGKVAGPIFGGFLVHTTDYSHMFQAMAALALATAASVWFLARSGKEAAAPPKV